MLKQLIEAKQARMAEIDTLIEKSQDINEVKALGKEKRSLQQVQQRYLRRGGSAPRGQF